MELVVAAEQGILTWDEARDLAVAEHEHGVMPEELHGALEVFLLCALDGPSRLVH